MRTVQVLKFGIKNHMKLFYAVIALLILSCPVAAQYYTPDIKFSDFMPHDHYLFDDRTALESKITTGWTTGSTVEFEWEICLIKAQPRELIRCRLIFFLAIRASDSYQTLGDDSEYG